MNCDDGDIFKLGTLANIFVAMIIIVVIVIIAVITKIARLLIVGGKVIAQRAKHARHAFLNAIRPAELGHTDLLGRCPRTVYGIDDRNFTDGVAIRPRGEPRGEDFNQIGGRA